MHMINSVIVEGVVHDFPLYRENKDGRKVCSLDIAVERTEKDTIETSCFTVEGYGTLAESMYDILAKGTKLRIVGRLKHENCTAADGKSYGRVFIVAEYFERLK